ncbi:MAG: diaminopimelate decarboxylase [Patescibacteria group bacterium]
MQLPRYEYSRSKIKERLDYLISLSAPYGLTVRFAAKANPHPEVISLMREAGLHFDASSSYEAAELMQQGVPGSSISLSSQQSPHNLPELLKEGVLFVATSLKQLGVFLATEDRPNTVGIRINPSTGHGHNKRTTTGGVSASFGIWHEYAKEAVEIARAEGVLVDRIHIHVGSGADPAVWGGVMDRSLEVMEEFEHATSLDIGGGFKVERYEGEQEADLKAIMAVFAEKLVAFKERTGRELLLEIEPGTYVMAHAGTLVAHVDDIVDTGSDGHTFLRLTTGMNDFMRSALYGARHRIEVMNDAQTTKEYIVVGHNCESGDIFTPAPGNPEEIETRTLKEAAIGDEVRIYDTGTYCASMRVKGYNSFPDATEVVVD